MGETRRGWGDSARSRALASETHWHVRYVEDVRRMSHNPATTVPAPVLCPQAALRHARIAIRQIHMRDHRRQPLATAASRQAPWPPSLSRPVNLIAGLPGEFSATFGDGARRAWPGRRGTTRGTSAGGLPVQPVLSGHFRGTSVQAVRPGRCSGLLLIRWFRVRAPGAPPRGLHISPVSMFTFGSDILGCRGHGCPAG